MRNRSRLDPMIDNRQLRDELLARPMSAKVYEDFQANSTQEVSDYFGQQWTVSRTATTNASGYLNSLGLVRYPTLGNSPRYEVVNGVNRGIRLDATTTNLLGNTVNFGTSGATYNWVQTSISGAGTLNATGPDGTTSAVTLTSSAANGTISQSRGAVGVGGRVFSVWLRRPTGGGSGNIQIAYNTAGTWTTVSVTSSWQRFSVSAGSGSALCGIRLVTSGDKVEAYAPMLQVYVGTKFKSAGPELIALAANTASGTEALYASLPESSNAATGCTIFLEYEMSDRYGLANSSTVYAAIDDGSDSYLVWTAERSDESVIADNWMADVYCNLTAYAANAGDINTTDRYQRLCFGMKDGAARFAFNGSLALDAVDANIQFPNWADASLYLAGYFLYIRKIAIWDHLLSSSKMVEMTKW